MFAGLFVVVAGLERAVLTPDRIAAIAALGLHHMPTLGLVTAALSNIVSNVPAVLVLILLLEEIWAWKTLNLSQSHQVQFALFAEEMTLMSRAANRSATAQAAA